MRQEQDDIFTVWLSCPVTSVLGFSSVTARQRPTGRPNRQITNETWIRAHDGSAARHVDHLLGVGGLSPRVLLAGHGDEPIEAQALVAADHGITITYDLNLIINPGQIVSRPLKSHSSIRHIQAAYLPGQTSPAVTAGIQALRHVRQHRRQQLTGDGASPGVL